MTTCHRHQWLLLGSTSLQQESQSVATLQHLSASPCKSARRTEPAYLMWHWDEVIRSHFAIASRGLKDSQVANISRSLIASLGPSRAANASPLTKQFCKHEVQFGIC